MNVLEVKATKATGRKLTMVTCYDAWSAKILNDSPIDMLLVGDSAAMVMHGFEDTIPATVDLLEPHVQAVKRGAPKKLIVADLPFLSFRSDLRTNIQNVQRLMQAGGHAVKLEGYDKANHEIIQHLTESGIPVMGHLGLTPQFVNAFGGFKVQGRQDAAAKKIIEQAHGLERAGCFAVVLECVPGNLAADTTRELNIPTIGIGAGSQCDGQVLVLHDLLGLSTGFQPKFVRKYLNGADQIAKALAQFSQDVKAGIFPSEKETYASTVHPSTPPEIQA